MYSTKTLRNSFDFRDDVDVELYSVDVICDRFEEDLLGLKARSNSTVSLFEGMICVDQVLGSVLRTALRSAPESAWSNMLSSSSSGLVSFRSQARSTLTG